MARTIVAMGERGERHPRAGRRGLGIGRLMGVPIQVNASVVLLAVLVAVLYGRFVAAPRMPTMAGYAVGLGFVACLLGSVLLHELGHALTARRYGIGVRGITLELLGGYTELERDAPDARVDLKVSLAGPAVSGLLGMIATAATYASPDHSVIDQLAFQLAFSNLLIAGFNVLPGLPLDGGRALRAVLWAALRDRHLATQLAGWAGRGVALGSAAALGVLVATGVVRPVGLVLIFLVAVPLWQGAGRAVRIARISRDFPHIDLAGLARPIFEVPTGTPLSEARRRAASAGRTAAVVGVADASGQLFALVDGRAVQAVPPARRPWVPVDAVARALDLLPTLPLSLSGERLLRAVQVTPGAQYVVRHGEDVVGVVHTADLAQLLKPKRKPRT